MNKVCMFLFPKKRGIFNIVIEIIWKISFQRLSSIIVHMDIKTICNDNLHYIIPKRVSIYFGCMHDM